MQQVIAKGRYIRSSAQKMRLVVNMIRGKTVVYALDFLSFSNKKSAILVKKVINSAVANARHNYHMDINLLKIVSIFVDSGPSMKRIMPRAKGRSDRLLKRTSHLTVILSNI